jgi:hypothetical protein
MGKKEFGFETTSIHGHSGIYPDYLHGDSIISVPLDEDEEMQLGYVTLAKRELGELGRIYIDEIKKYDPALAE